jgi:hypothetical protein
VLAIDSEPDARVIVTQYEGNCRHGKYLTLRARLKDAWRTFRGEGRCWEEFVFADGLDDFIAALQEARVAAFGAKV